MPWTSGDTVPAEVVASDEWILKSKARSVTRVTSDDGIPKRVISRDSLRLQVVEAKPVVLPVEPRGFWVQGDRFPVLFDTHQLCAELERIYPNSTFYFPQAKDLHLPPVGFVEVYDRPTFRFQLSAVGTSPTADFPDGGLRADRWYRYQQVSRTFRIDALDSEARAEIQVRLMVDKDGVELSDARDLVSLEIIDLESSEMEGWLTPGTEFSITAPAVAQTWREWTPLGLFDREPGGYEIRICFTPRLESDATLQAQAVVVCADCDELRVTDNPACVVIPVELVARPLSWPVLAVWVFVFLFLAWVALRWVRRTNFRDGLVIGNLKDDIDLARAYGKGLRGKMSLVFRLPGFLVLSSTNDNVRFLGKMPMARRGRKTRGTVLGIRPLAGGFVVWCVSVDDPNLRVIPNWDRNALEPQGSKVPARGEATRGVQSGLSYRKIDPNSKLLLQKSTQNEPERQMQEYQISLVKKSSFASLQRMGK